MARLSPDDVISISPFTKYQKYDGEYILLNIKTGNYFHLDDAVSMFIWSRIYLPRTTREVINLVAEAFNGPRPGLERGVRRFLGHLLKEKLVCKGKPGPAP